MRLRRLGWPTLSQICSSASNIGISLAVARVATPAEFGSFAVIQTVYIIILVLARSVIGHPAVIYTHAPRMVGTVALKIGGVVAVSAFPLMVVLSGDATLSLLVALLIPFMIVQDSLRSRDIGLDSGLLSFWSDGLWLMGFTTLWLVLQILNTSTPVLLLGSWCVAGMLSVIPLLVRYRSWSRERSMRTWWLQVRRMSSALTLDVLATQAGNQVVVVVLGLAGGLTAIGELRSSQLLLSPLNFLVSLLPLIIIPRVRSWDSHGTGLQRLLQVAASCMAVPVLLLLLYEVVPDAYGEAVFAQGWRSAQQYLPFVALGNVGAAAVIVISSFMRARGQADRIVKSRLGALPMEPAGTLLGAVSGGPRAAVIGMAIGQGIATLPWILGAFNKKMEVAMPSHFESSQERSK